MSHPAVSLSLRECYTDSSARLIAITPSPRQANAFPYPFRTTETVYSSSPPSSNAQMVTPAWPSLQLKSIQMHKAPIARASNPMLGMAYQNEAVPQANDALGDGINRLNKDLEIIGGLGKGEFSQVWRVKDRAGNLWAVKAGKPYSGAKNR